MRFLIQKERGHVAHDFGFHLIKAIEYNNWYFKSNDMQYTLCELDEIQLFPNAHDEHNIPIGSIEFVHTFLKQVHGLDAPHPLNIPKQLLKPEFTGRDVEIGDLEDIRNYHRAFVKSNTKLKGFTGIVEGDNLPPELVEDEYLISEVVDFESEWRGFVHHNKLIDLRNYSGNPFMFPSVERIEEMIETYHPGYLSIRYAPVAYTIDVGLLSNGETVIIECHNFYSCGLYGFCDYRKLPVMFSQWWYEYLNKFVKI